MRRAVLLLAGMVLAVLLAGGIAVAADIICPTSDDGSGLCRGTEEDDTLYGTVDFDRMWAYGGNDTLNGHEGADDLWGMAGNDVLYCNEGSDTLGFTEDHDGYADGNDTFYGGRGDDILEGGPGQDKAYGGKGEINSTDTIGQTYSMAAPVSIRFTAATAPTESLAGKAATTSRPKKTATWTPSTAAPVATTSGTRRARTRSPGIAR